MVNLLFLCTGNSARSILAEALLNQLGRERFRAHSAGSRPKGSVHPFALEVLRHAGIETAGLRSKSWDEFSTPQAPRMDLVITLCDEAAGETCPVWPGQPATAHWGFADPEAIQGSPQQQLTAFEHTLRELAQRIEDLVNLPAEKLDRWTLQQHANTLA